MYVAGAFYVGMLLGDNAFAVLRLHSGVAFEQDFAIKFNEFYCDAHLV